MAKATPPTGPRQPTCRHPAECVALLFSLHLAVNRLGRQRQRQQRRCVGAIRRALVQPEQERRSPTAALCRCASHSTSGTDLTPRALLSSCSHDSVPPGLGVKRHTLPAAGFMILGGLGAANLNSLDGLNHGLNLNETSNHVRVGKTGFASGNRGLFFEAPRRRAAAPSSAAKWQSRVSCPQRAVHGPAGDPWRPCGSSAVKHSKIDYLPVCRPKL